LGPFYMPGEGACRNCFDLRLSENAPSPQAVAELAAAREQMAQSQQAAPAFGTLAAYRHWAAALAAAEIVALLSGHRPLRTLNRIITLDLEELTTHDEPCWRVPWCPTCGDGRDRA